MKLETFAFYVKTMHEKYSPQFPIKFCENCYEVSSHHVQKVCANPITVISPVTPTVMDPITKMEVAHTVRHAFIAGFPCTPPVLPSRPFNLQLLL